MLKAVQYGAGNIGRGFIGQIFSLSGYETVFIDVNIDLVNKINQDKKYPIKTVSQTGSREEWVENISAIDGRDLEKVAIEIAGVDIMATAVGVNILPRIAKPIALGLKKRWSNENFSPLNIIICENMIHADQYLCELIKCELTDDEKRIFDEKVGLVEASVGRMVPIMTTEMQEGNILKVWVEEYCQLPVNLEGFKGELPRLVNLLPFSPFDFYIQRKLFIHNMGHALTAYLGFLNSNTFIWEAIENASIKIMVRNAMVESATALSKEHNYPLQEILAHVDDLIYRFGNRYLGDTIERVGRDPIRKLSANDRLVASAKLCAKHQVNPEFICIGIAYALKFNQCGDEAAKKLQIDLEDKGISYILENICGLKDELQIVSNVTMAYQLLGDGADLVKLLRSIV